MSPSMIYAYVTAGAPATFWEETATPVSCRTGGVDDSLHGVTLFDISPQIVAEYYSEAHSVWTQTSGVTVCHPRGGGTCHCHRPASQRRHHGRRRGVPVALPRHRTPHLGSRTDIDWRPIRATSTRGTNPAPSPVASDPHSDAVDSDADPCGVSRLVAIVPVTRAAVTIAIVHHHWCREDDHPCPSLPYSVRHHSVCSSRPLRGTRGARDPRRVRVALLDGGVSGRRSDASSRPPTMSQSRVPLPSRGGAQTRHRRRHVGMRRMVQRVVTRWGKSHMARGVDAPYLECRHLDALGDAQYRTRDGTFVAERVVDLDAIHATVHHVYEGAADSRTPTRASTRRPTTHGAASRRTLARRDAPAFLVVLTIASWGRDPQRGRHDRHFAVLRKWSGSGHGGRMFHDLICAIGSRHGTERFAVFAQCVRTGTRPGRYALDESGRHGRWCSRRTSSIAVWCRCTRIAV